jgi:HPt (histidine-containing phosphotransfer) domain-containing protein
MKREDKRFMAVSKFIGVIIGGLCATIIIYSMVMMAVLKDLSSLPTLIGGVLGLGATYVGFYISMAKAEHIEDKKNDIMKEIHKLKKEAAAATPEVEEKANELEQELDSVYNKLQEIENEETIVNP